MQPNKINILIVGASGNLGTLLTKEALKKPNLQVSILVRNPEKVADLAEEVKKSGGNVIKGDLADIPSLQGATKGIHTVIFCSTVHDEKVFHDGHIALFKDAEANGVTRIVPNIFSTYVKGIPREETSRYKLFEQKDKLDDDYLKTSNLKKLTIYCGTFMETYFLYQKFGPGSWGEPNQPLCLTSYADTAAFTIAAVANPEQTGDLCIYGDYLSVKQTTDIYNKVRGANVEAKHNGSLAELKNLFEESLKGQDFMKILYNQLYLVVYDDRSNPKKNDNEKYPEVKFTSFEEFVKQHPELTL